MFDPKSDEFTLDEVFKLKLIANAEIVREVCEIAAKEFMIENALDGIDNKWANLEIYSEP